MFISYYNLYNIKAVRSGVIPFTIANNQLYFLMGIDNQTGEITDFGGGIKNNESIIQGAYREFQEETCGIFTDYVTIEDLYKSPILTNSKLNTFIFFVNIPFNWLFTADKKFYENQKCSTNKKCLEIHALKWINQTHFNNIAFNKKDTSMWKRIQNILYYNTNWYELRQNLFMHSNNVY